MPTDVREPLPEPGNWTGQSSAGWVSLPPTACASNVMLAARWFHHLGHHVRQTHSLTADEYVRCLG